ncbi:Osi8 [Drosophila busckii]|uniref:Osi8 n=1 Tax=Drosophila busckii TaxID=30019 RepID=A0A0M3QY14_DROBS|nr:Osi8 [Drosophila busckii]
MIKYVWHVAALMIVFCWLPGSLARSTSYHQMNSLPLESQQKTQHQQQQPASAPSLWKDLSLVYRIYQQCTGENMSVCLKVKLLTGLEKAFRSSRSLSLLEGIQFVSSGDEAQKRSQLPPINEQDIEAVLPRSVDAKEQVLNSMILKRVSSFLQDHTLQVSQANIINSVEGRKKKDKKGSGAYIMIPLLLGGTLVPIAYGALAMLAGKALIVSKLALVLASIIGIKKLLSGGGGGKESSHEVVVSSGSHSGWGRDFDMAYSGWKPAKEAAVGSSKSL